jgi:hypothetical protein
MDWSGQFYSLCKFFISLILLMPMGQLEGHSLFKESKQVQCTEWASVLIEAIMWTIWRMAGIVQCIENSWHHKVVYFSASQFCEHFVKSNNTTKFSLVYVLLGISPASDFGLPTFQNPLSGPSSKAGCRIWIEDSMVFIYVGGPKKNQTGFGELFLIVVECSCTLHELLARWTSL